MKIKPFYIVVIDDDLLTFQVKGPMSDDRLLNNRIAAEQEKGRNVRCFTAPENLSSESEIIKNFRMNFPEYSLAIIQL